MDFDIDHFEITSPKEFVDLAKRFEKDTNIDAIFPVSHPFYYDIFALRAVELGNYKFTACIYQAKKYLRLGSFYGIIYLFFENNGLQIKLKK